MSFNTTMKDRLMTNKVKYKIVPKASSCPGELFTIDEERLRYFSMLGVFIPRNGLMNRSQFSTNVVLHRADLQQNEPAAASKKHLILKLQRQARLMRQ